MASRERPWVLLRQAWDPGCEAMRDHEVALRPGRLRRGRGDARVGEARGPWRLLLPLLLHTRAGGVRGDAPTRKEEPARAAASAHPPAATSTAPRFADVEAAAQSGGGLLAARGSPPLPSALTLRPLCSMALQEAVFKRSFEAPCGAEGPRNLSPAPASEACLVPRKVGGWSASLRDCESSGLTPAFPPPAPQAPAPSHIDGG